MEIQTGTDYPARPLSPPVAAFKRYTELLAACGTLLIFGLMLLIVADVAGRNFFSSPITGVAEIAARCVVAIVFLQISGAVMAGRMTRADFLVNILNPRVPGLVRAMDALFCILGALVFAAIAYASWPDTADAWRTNDFFGVQGVFTIPTLPFRIVNIIGAASATVAYLIIAAQALTAPDEGR